MLQKFLPSSQSGPVICKVYYSLAAVPADLSNIRPSLSLSLSLSLYVFLDSWENAVLNIPMNAMQKNETRSEYAKSPNRRNE